MKRRWWFALIAIVLLAMAFVGVFAYDRTHVGKVLDSYRGVSVYDNGLLFFRSHGRNYASDGYYYGQKWQCVEFIKRFYHEAKRHRMPDVLGHAMTFFDEPLEDGALNQRRGLIQYRNGSSMKPQPDDILVFTDTKYGHVGIVTQVTRGSVEIIQQNVFGHTRQRLLMAETNDHYYVTSPRKPAGWMRLPPWTESH